MEQSEQARLAGLRDSQQNEQKLVEGIQPDGHWPEGQHAPKTDKGFDRRRQGAPRADDRSEYVGQSAYGSLEAGGGDTSRHLGSAQHTAEKGVQGSAPHGADQGAGGAASRGGLSSYGNNLGSRFNADHEGSTSQRPSNALTTPLGDTGAVAGAAPASTRIGQYGGEYDDASSQDEATLPGVPSEVVARPGTTPQDGVEPRGEQQIDDQIRQRMLEHPDLDIHDVSVSTHHHRVTLEGSVPTAHMKELIVQIVDNVNGVVNLDDRLTVQRVDPANHASAQAYATGAQVSGDVQHSGPATFGAASAAAASVKEQQEHAHDKGSDGSSIKGEAS